MKKPDARNLKSSQTMFKFQDHTIEVTRRRGRGFQRGTIRLSELIDMLPVFLYEDKIFGEEEPTR